MRLDTISTHSSRTPFLGARSLLRTLVRAHLVGTSAILLAAPVCVAAGAPVQSVAGLYVTLTDVPTRVAAGDTLTWGVTVTPHVPRTLAWPMSMWVDGRALEFGTVGLSRISVEADAATFTGTLRIPVRWRPGPLVLTLRVMDEQGRGGVVSLQTTVTPAADDDGDGLPDAWETTWGLSPTSASGSDGANGDPDSDGLTNTQEFARQSHPRGTPVRYFAEGVFTDFFGARVTDFEAPDAAEVLSPPLTFINLSPTTDAHVLVRYLREDGEVRSTEEAFHLQAGVSHRQAGPWQPVVWGLWSHAFSMVVEAEVEVQAYRTILWGDGRSPEEPARLTRPWGEHRAAGAPQLYTTWYFAEGSTAPTFSLFYLLGNPQDVPAEVTLQYLLPDGQPPRTRTYQVAPHSRLTVWVDHEEAALPPTAMGATVTSTVPIVAERAMYVHGPGVPYLGGAVGLGLTAPRRTTYFAEGSTGSFFDTYLLLANPSGTEARVEVDYLRPSGAPLTRAYRVPAFGRLTVLVDGEDPGLTNTDVSLIVRTVNDVPVVAERAMWWDAADGAYSEGHVSSGLASPTQTGVVGGPVVSDDVYLLVLNPGTDAVTLEMATWPFGPPNSGPPSLEWRFQRVIPPYTRQTVRLGQEEGLVRFFEEGDALSWRSVGGPLVVESAGYELLAPRYGQIPFRAGSVISSTSVP